jgi:putative ABC transport system permease protein
VRLEPLKTNYFNTQYSDYSLLHGNASQVKTLALIGLVILALAVINYANLATAGYKYRLTEIGIKKCLGVGRRVLIAQLLTESLLFCLGAALLGIVLAEVFLPYFNQYVEKPLHLWFFADMRFSLLFLAFIFVLSLITVFLPAVLLSKISPLALFRRGPLFRGSGSLYRSGLSVLQFGAAIILICCLFVMSEQIDYAKHKDPGFTAEQLLYLSLHHQMGDKVPALTDRLRQYHGLKALTITNGIPGKINLTLNGFATIVIDTNALETFGFQLVQGRNLLAGDVNKACLVNTTALEKFDRDDFRGHEISGLEIVGVVSDFHFASLYDKIAPLALCFAEWDPNHITMRISGPVEEAVSYIRKAWAEICPDFPFDLQCYDDAFAAMYRQEEKLARLISIFAVLAVVISCMGIFGLAVFQSEQRVKEIGIRKVLGATVAEITAMLTKNFTKWVLVANVVAWPVAYFVAGKWLENFAYRIEMEWWMFALSGGLALLIALVTVSTQAIKVALANPVEALRYE